MAEEPFNLRDATHQSSEAWSSSGLLRFFGRIQEINDLLGLLASNRLITILGIGGMGKSTLARLTLDQLPEPRPKIHWISFEDFVSASPDSPLRYCGLQMGLNNIEDAINPHAVISDHIRATPTLLVLDGCETIIPQVNGIVALLNSCPNLKILTTSRQTIGIPGEIVFHLGPLSLQSSPSLSLVSEAVALFEDRARLADSSFRITPTNLDDIEAIVRLVGGAPLGIEWSAALAEIIPTDELAALLLSDLKPILDDQYAGDKNQQARIRSLNTVLQWTWDALNEHEKNTLGHLSFFEGSFSHEAAEAVAGANLLGLRAMLRRALISRTPDRRFMMPELLRSYTRLRLPESVRNQVQLPFARHYLGILASASDQNLAKNLCTDDREHISRAFEVAIELGEWPLLDGAIDNLPLLYRSQGAIKNAADLLERASQKALAQNTSKTHLARLLCWQAYFNGLMGLFPVALKLVEKAAALLPLDTTPPNFKQWLNYLRSWCYLESSNLQQAEEFLVLAETDREKPPPFLEMNLTRMRANLEIRRRQFEAAQVALTKALTLAKTHKSSIMSAHALLDMSAIASKSENQVTAQALITEAMEIINASDDQYLQAKASYLLAEALAKQGEYAKAITAHKRARDLLRWYGDIYGEQGVELQLAVIYASLGDTARSAKHLDRCSSLMETTGAKRLTWWIRFTQGLNAMTEMNYAAAKPLLISAYQSSLDQIDPELGPFAATLLVHCHIGLGEYTEALSQMEIAYDAWDSIGGPVRGARVSCDTAALRLAIVDGDQTAMRELSDKILKTFSERGAQMHWYPFSSYLICYTAYTILGSSRAAEVLTTAHNLLLKIASQFDDMALQNSFLYNVPENAALMRFVRKQASAQNNLLTDRQLEVLKLIDVGMTNQEIADKLFISLETVRRHVADILGRMDVKNRSSAAHKAHQMGLLK